MIRIDRRQLITAASYGIGALMLPAGRAFAQAQLDARGFTHGVASGEPAADSVLLWTRYVGAGDDAHVRAEIAATPDFARVISGASMITGPWRDWTAKITLAGLMPGRRYYYRFIGPDGGMSSVGRTKTLPVGPLARCNLAVFSCSNIGFGWFNAYAHAAARDDVDFCIHLGDYLYEAKKGIYPSLEDALRPDRIVPDSELIHLADYRMRYASYRSDPDLQAFHARHPMIASMDDHEGANDSWEGGAAAHDPATEGDWSVRKAAAFQAYREWLPIDDMPYKSYDLGTLGTLFRTDTRLLARSHQRNIAQIVGSGDPGAALRAFKAGAWGDPAETMMGTTQENWLNHAFRQSVRSGRRWQVVGMGTTMGYGEMPKDALSWLKPDAPERNRKWVANGIAAAQAGLPFNFDSWGGYPAARERFLRLAQTGNTVLISGDSHNAWAFDLPVDGRPAAVEFAGHSVTSPGNESEAAAPPATVAAGYVASSRELKWCDTSRRGYMSLALTPEAATNEWIFMDTIRTRTTATQASHRMRVTPGRAKLVTV